ncbi:MAG: biotin--[acetyl-CoA-carboxylase] ligase [Balneolaceae bacterium]
MGRSAFCFKELDSTNSHAKKMRIDASLHGSVVLADHQTGGRGQHSRKWQTEAGANLTFSLIFAPKKQDRFTLLTLACALAVSEAIEEETGICTRLKWPNDILHEGQKICGILTETQFSGSKLERIIIGIGLNVNQLNFSEELASIATSLAIINSKKIKREQLLAAILKKTEYYYRLWTQYKPELVKQINRALIGYGNWVHILINGKEMNGEYKFLGVNDTGALVVLNSRLEVQTFAYEQVRVKEQ